MYQTNEKRQAPTGQIDLFCQRIPARPYHTNSLGQGLSIADAQRALRSRYIQPNGPTHKYWLVFDIDRAGALMDWSDLRAPPPNLAVINPENHHGHLIYGLEIPIRTAPDGRQEPIRYAGAIENALADVLQADLGYSGLICKNPAHEHWSTHIWESNLYDLDGLASWLDLSAYSDRRKNLPAYGLGRNCTLFDRLRHWAYKAIRQGWPEYDRWLMAVEQRATGYNDFDSPLPRNEVHHIAKSVAQYTFKRITPEGFSAWQAAQGRKGGLAKGKLEREKLMPIVLEMLADSHKVSDIAREIGKSRQTVSNWIKR